MSHFARKGFPEPALKRPQNYVIKKPPMKKNIGLFLAFLIFLPLAHADRQLLDQVVAVVNDDAITQSELDMLMRPLYEDYKRDYTGETLLRMLNEARQKLLNQLIEDRLVFQEAKNQKLEIDDSEIEAKIEEFKKRFKSDQQMEDALQLEGLNLNDMRDRLRRQAMIQRLHDTEIRSKIVVSPIEIEEYYKEHSNEFANDERLRVRSMTIKKDILLNEKGLTDEIAKKKADELRNKTLSGENFGELARQYSEDTNAKNEGLGDWIERGSMIAAIDEVIFTLKPGEVSPVIETQMGFHFFRVEERMESKKKTLEEAREEIYAKIFRKKFQEQFQEWMERLKRNAYVSIR